MSTGSEQHVFKQKVKAILFKTTVFVRHLEKLMKYEELF